MMDVAVQLQYGTLRHGTHSTIQCLEIKSIGTLFLQVIANLRFDWRNVQKGRARGDGAITIRDNHKVLIELCFHNCQGC